MEDPPRSGPEASAAAPPDREAGFDEMAPSVDQVPAMALEPAIAIDLLTRGDMEVIGRLVAASNLNLYCRITLRHSDGGADLVAACVYKPISGERPLDDFPDGTLAHREVAAYLVSEAIGWTIVPPTVLRDGPLGPGMVQLWIDVDESVEVVDLVRGGDPALRRMAVFDAVVNNADRKGGHMLPVEGGHVYGVDHGVCFSPDPKLRTILWGWRGRRLAAHELAMLASLEEEMGRGLGESLRQLLAPEEVRATTRRIRRLRTHGTFPQPSPNWPAIPWPPF